MVFAYLEENNTEDIRHDGELAYILRAIGFVRVQRKKNFTFPYRNGKDRHSLVLLVRTIVDTHVIDKA